MKTYRQESVGKSVVRIIEDAQGYAGMVATGNQRSAIFRSRDPEELWQRLLSEVGRASPEYFGYEGARARFAKMFPGGFDATFDARERDYKLAAKALLDEALPLDEAVQGSFDPASVMRVFSRTNILSQFELMRTRDVLFGPRGGDFIKGAARLAHGDMVGLQMIAGAFAPAGRASWPVATYLPFFWAPERCMYLKPEVTKDFATRVGHPFAHRYEAALTASVYESLLDLTAEVRRELEVMKPRDLIDVQSFIWVVGAYTDANASPEPALAD